MSLENLTKTGDKLGNLYTRKLKKREKDPFRLSLQAYAPQTAAQDLNVLKNEIRELSKEQASKDVNGNPVTTLPVLTLSEDKCVSLYKSIFEKYKDSQATNTFNGKKKGTDGVLLDKELYNELIKSAKSAVGSGNWLIAPCWNLNSFNNNVKKKYADELAKLEIQNRRGSSRKADDVEESFISKRLTGFQGGHVPGGPNKGQEYRPGTGLTDYEKTETGVQLGHGDKGQPTFAYKSDEAKQIIRDAEGLGNEDKLRLIQKIEKQEEKLGIQVEHKEHVTMDGLKKNYKFLLFTGQRTKENVKDQKEEVAKGTEMANFMVDQVMSDHDSKIDKTIGSLILHRLTKNNKGVRNTSKRHKPKRVIKSKEKTPRKDTKYTTKKRRAIAVGGAFDIGRFAKKVVVGSKKVRKPKSTLPAVGTAGSPLQALAILNASLEQAIRDNMGGSALHNRTGRFASSVHVHNIAQTAGTEGTVQYSYMYNPYKVYEGDGTRDPRLLIDKTIREQAAEMALGRFTTQRV